MEEEYHLLILSRYNHQEGYLDLMLSKLIERFGSKIQTYFDKYLNPYLIIKNEDFKSIKAELEKKVLKYETSESGNFRLLTHIVDKCEIHKVIQEEDSKQFKKHTHCSN